eukprot:32111_1
MANYGSSEDMSLSYHNYPTPANTPRSVSRRQYVQVNELKSDTHDATNSLSVSKIERMLNTDELDLEMEMLQKILEECKYDSMSETSVELETITDINLNGASMYVHIVHLDGKCVETFL